MTSALLCALSAGGTVGIAIAAVIIGVVAGLFGYRFYSKKKIGIATQESAKLIDEANKIKEEARLEAKSIRKEGLLEAKEEKQRLRAEIEKEAKESKAELQRMENRLLQKESNIDKKEDALDKKLEQVEAAKKGFEEKEQKLQERENELANAEGKLQQELERVSGMTCEEASEILKASLLEDVKKRAATEAKDIEAEARDHAERKAREIVSQAIQRCAADYTAETTVSVVALPNDEIKGRIIGRVGRNIRALESATGVDLIIDDTPDVVTLSCFDAVRREVARLTMEKLIADGRIHPARIEETVDKVRREVELTMKEAGESAATNVGVFNLHPEIVKLLGRLRYRTSYGQNVLGHSLEVSYLAGVMAAELGADVKIAKRAGLLHDIGKAIDHEIEGTHIQIGVDVCKKYKENPAVIHAIAAHHGDIAPETVEAVLVQAADAISSARPGARRESLENYVKRIEKLEDIANSFKGVEQSYAVQAGREIRVIVKPEVVDDASTVFLSQEIAEKLESELDYPGQIKVSVIRETRSVHYAK